MKHADTIIIGAGIMGFSLAYELAKRERSVVVIDRQKAGQGASWAAAGILPAVCRTGVEHDDFERLKTLSWHQYPEWVEELERESGISVDFQRCGGLHLATSAGELVSLQVAAKQWQADGHRVEPLASSDAWQAREPGLQSVLNGGLIQGGFWMPDEMVVRPPRLLKALMAACRARGVTLLEDIEIRDWRRHGAIVAEIETNQGPILADQFCLTGGAWSSQLAADCGLELEIEPWRGQMVMFRASESLLRTVVNRGPNYLVPRSDHRVLVGSTMEEVGFDSSTTEQRMEELKRFATTLLPGLKDAEVEASWAGLRPGSRDGKPFIGKTPASDNLFVATGHFRNGIFLAPATARLMSQLLLGDALDLSLDLFHVGRN